MILSVMTPLPRCSTASVRSMIARSSSVGVMPALQQCRISCGRSSSIGVMSVAQPWEQINSTKTKRRVFLCCDALHDRKHRVGALSMSAQLQQRRHACGLITVCDAGDSTSRVVAPAAPTDPDSMPHASSPRFEIYFRSWTRHTGTMPWQAMRIRRRPVFHGCPHQRGAQASQLARCLQFCARQPPIHMSSRRKHHNAGRGALSTTAF